MITTSMQLKAKVRNLSKGDDARAKILIRNFFMERFLERTSLSPYRNNFILKGGMLVAAIVGLETRATMDIDTTVKSLPLTMENARKVIEEIVKINVPDGVSFAVTKVSNIMEGHDYPGVRIMMGGTLERLRQAIKIDISTGDVITPQAIEFSYNLMFENRSISIWAYNLATILGEKLETVMARENANTRMRDFYDVYILTKRENIDYKALHDAFLATCEKRGTTSMIPRLDAILETVRIDPFMKEMWNKYRQENFFVGDLTWEDVNVSVNTLIEKVFSLS